MLKHLSLIITILTSYATEIKYGIPATVGQFPYHVSTESNGHHICSGAIYNSHWIITGRVCVQLILRNGLEESFIRVGTINLNTGRRIQIQEAIKHSPEGTNDIGLIKLSEEITFDSNVKPIELSEETIGDNISAVLSGWCIIGHDPKPGLRYERVRTTSHGVCKRISPTNLCTTSFIETGNCLDDIGSPLVLNGKLIGIATPNTPCAQGFPEVYARISKFLSWINEVTATN